MPQWVDEDGKRVSLGERVGPRGGEGEIFRVQGEPTFVAKIYHQPGDTSKAEKLRRLRQLANPALAKVAAWPARCLFVADGSGKLAGFTMPFGQGRRVERLYNPRDRRQDFPRAGWDFLLHVARNCAAAFETLHEHKVIMADVNEGNVLVTDDGLVRLIDCDSYQVDRPNGVAMTCDVGVPLWTPPELQGRSLQGLVRTVDHDRFGLAVLIFHLLFMGRHPYAGVPLSRQPEDLPIDAAIKRGQFAFGTTHPALVLRPPPHTLNLAAFPSSVGNLFERAFGPLRGNGINGGPNRPSGREWADVLGTLPVRRCTSNPLHAYPESAPTCPWCRIQREGGPAYFNILVPGDAASASQVEKLWRIIADKQPVTLKVRALGEYPISDLQPVPVPPGLHPVNEGWQHRLLLVCFGVSPANPAYAAERRRRQTMVERSRIELDRALAAVGTSSAEYQRHFASKRTELEGHHRRCLSLDNERTNELRKLESNKREVLLNHFLDSCIITPNIVNGIGHHRKAVLNSYGIETALDVTPKMKVPGIGPALLGGLLVWRRQMEARFVFNPGASLPATVTTMVDQRLRDERNNLEARLRNGPAELDGLALYAKQAIDRSETAVHGLARAHAQATVDLQHVPEAAVAKELVNRHRIAVAIVGGVLLLLWMATWHSSQPTSIKLLPVAPDPGSVPMPSVSTLPTPNFQPAAPNPAPTSALLQMTGKPVYSAPTPQVQLPSSTPAFTLSLKSADKPILKAKALTYRVIGVSSADTLNVRSGPGEKYSVVERLPSTATGIQIAGATRMNGQDAWAPVRTGSQSGWVIQRFLEAE